MTIAFIWIHSWQMEKMLRAIVPLSSNMGFTSMLVMVYFRWCVAVIREESLWGKSGWTIKWSMLKQKFEKSFQHFLAGRTISIRYWNTMQSTWEKLPLAHLLSQFVWVTHGSPIDQYHLIVVFWRTNYVSMVEKVDLDVIRNCMLNLQWWRILSIHQIGLNNNVHIMFVCNNILSFKIANICKNECESCESINVILISKQIYEFFEGTNITHISKRKCIMKKP